MSEEPVCARCGQCCFLTINGKPNKNFPCPHLWISEDGSWTKCKIWGKRESGIREATPIRIGFNNVCYQRKLSKYDYEGCPYNCPNGSKPIVKIEVKR